MPHLVSISYFSKENRKYITWFVCYSPCLIFCIEYTKYIGEALESLCVLWHWDSLYQSGYLALIYIYLLTIGIYMVNMNFTCNTFLLRYARTEMWNFQVSYLINSKREMWNFQVPYLIQWGEIEGSHASCLRGATTALSNASLRLPIIGSVNVRLQYFIRHQFCHYVHKAKYHVVWYACRPTARNLQKSLSQQHNYLNRFHLASKISYQRWDYRDFWKTYIPKQCDA